MKRNQPSKKRSIWLSFTCLGCLLSSSCDAPSQLNTTTSVKRDTLEQQLSSPAQSDVDFVDIAPYLSQQGNSPTWGLSFGDVDRDGLPDMFLADHMHFPSQLWLNQDGLFFPQKDTGLDVLSGMDDHHGAWTDLDADGDLDLFTANGFYRDDNALLQSAPVEFTRDVTLHDTLRGHEGRGRSVVIADFTGNGLDDVFVINLRTPNHFYRNTSKNVLREEGELRGLGYSFSASGAIRADFNRDGAMDLFIPCNDHESQLLINLGTGVFFDSGQEDINRLERSIGATAGDIDGDGHCDLLVLRDNGDIQILLGDGSGQLHRNENAVIPRLPMEGSGTLGLADLDNDGDLDLVVSNGGSSESQNGMPHILLNDGRGEFRLTEWSASESPAPGSAASLAFADWNLDGWIDFVISNGYGVREITGPVQLFQNRGSLTSEANWVRVATPRDHGSREGSSAIIDVLLDDDRKLIRESGGSRAFSQDQSGTLIGVGEHQQVKNIRVTWPDGATAQRQFVPVRQTVLIPAQDHDVVIRSHPAFLMSQPDEQYWDRLERTLGELVARENWPAPNPSDLQNRIDELRTWYRVTTIGKEQSQRKGDASPEREIPDRKWLEFVSIGTFAETGQPPASHPRLLQLAKAHLAAGHESLVIAEELDLRAFGKGKRGAIRRGWYSQASVEAMFGKKAEAVWDSQPGEVLGPFPMKEPFDLQDKEGTWPLDFVVRVGDTWKSSHLLSPKITRMQLEKRNRLRSLLADDKIPYDEKISLDVPPSRTVMIDHVAVELLKTGSDSIPSPAEDLDLAMERAKRESQLNAVALQVWEQQFQRQYKQRLETRQADPPEEHDFGYLRLLFFNSQGDALDTKRRLDSAADHQAVIAELGIPDVRLRESRNAKTFFVDAYCDEAFLRRILPGMGTRLEALAVDEVSGILPALLGRFAIAIRLQDSRPSEATSDSEETSHRYRVSKRDTLRSLNDLLFNAE